LKRQAASVPVMFAIVQAIFRTVHRPGNPPRTKDRERWQILGGKRLGRFLAKSGIAGRSVI
jgi:hypothetical protein